MAYGVGKAGVDRLTKDMAVGEKSTAEKSTRICSPLSNHTCKVASRRPFPLFSYHVLLGWVGCRRSMCVRCTDVIFHLTRLLLAYLKPVSPFMPTAVPSFFRRVAYHAFDRDAMKRRTENSVRVDHTMPSHV